MFVFKLLKKKRIKKNKKKKAVCPRNTIAPPLDNHQRKMLLAKKG